MRGGSRAKKRELDEELRQQDERMMIWMRDL